MATTLKAVAGAVDANSYATRDQAVEVFEAAQSSSAWATSIDAKRDAALIQATTEIEQRFTWRGERASPGQALTFPLLGLSRAGGTSVASDSIPTEIVRATALLADFILAGGESPGGVLSLDNLRGMRVSAQDALPGRVIAAIPAKWVRSRVGSTVAAISWG